MVVAYLSFPNFTLFWGQDALPIYSQMLWYTLIAIIGILMGIGLSYRAPNNAALTKEFLRLARQRLRETGAKNQKIIVLQPDVRHKQQYY
jgi:hypothetical protein